MLNCVRCDLTEIKMSKVGNCLHWAAAYANTNLCTIDHVIERIGNTERVLRIINQPFEKIPFFLLFVLILLSNIFFFM